MSLVFLAFIRSRRICHAVLKFLLLALVPVLHGPKIAHDAAIHFTGDLEIFDLFFFFHSTSVMSQPPHAGLLGVVDDPRFYTPWPRYAILTDDERRNVASLRRECCPCSRVTPIVPDDMVPCLSDKVKSLMRRAGHFQRIGPFYLCFSSPFHHLIIPESSPNITLLSIDKSIQIWYAVGRIDKETRRREMATKWVYDASKKTWVQQAGWVYDACKRTWVKA